MVILLENVVVDEEKVRKHILETHNNLVLQQLPI